MKRFMGFFLLAVLAALSVHIGARILEKTPQEKQLEALGVYALEAYDFASFEELPGNMMGNVPVMDLYSVDTFSFRGWFVTIPNGVASNIIPHPHKGVPLGQCEYFTPTGSWLCDSLTYFTGHLQVSLAK